MYYDRDANYLYNYNYINVSKLKKNKPLNVLNIIIEMKEDWVIKIIQSAEKREKNLKQTGVQKPTE